MPNTPEHNTTCCVEITLGFDSARQIICVSGKNRTVIRSVMLTIVSLHQGLAFGALGLLICALSDVRPAVKAVCSRFERLRPRSDQDYESDTVSVTTSSSDSLSNNDSEQDLHEAGANEQYPYGSKKPHTTRHMVHVTPTESLVHCDNCVCDQDLSCSSSWTSTVDILCTDSDSSDECQPGSASVSALEKARSNLLHKHGWANAENPVVSFLTLIAGILQIVFMMLSSTHNNRPGQKAILPIRHIHREK